MARVMLLKVATGCSQRTALRWLTGKATPQRGVQILQIAAALDITPSRLAGVTSESPILAVVVRKFMSLTPDQQLEAVCLLDRLANAERRKD